MRQKLNGILVIDKERGLTSHQVVANLRRIVKQTEIGHTGTLDPEATGVLVVGLGQATRSFPFLNEKEKEYRAEIVLGQTTDTQDATGTILQENSEFYLSHDQLKNALLQLTGEVSQIPPMYSAVKVHGQKLYDLARQGLEIERKPRLIKVYDWSLLHNEAGYRFKSIITVEITCSKGTYVRTLIHDLGMILGVGAHMGRLTRLRSGDFSLDDAITIAQVKEYFESGQLDSKLVTLAEALQHIPTIAVNSDDSQKITHGGKISFEKYPLLVEPGTIAKVLNDYGQLIALTKLEDAGTHRYWQPVRVFNYE